jgi:hypothetical protein
MSLRNSPLVCDRARVLKGVHCQTCHPGKTLLVPVLPCGQGQRGVFTQVGGRGSLLLSGDGCGAANFSRCCQLHTGGAAKVSTYLWDNCKAMRCLAGLLKKCTVQLSWRLKLLSFHAGCFQLRLRISGRVEKVERSFEQCQSLGFGFELPRKGAAAGACEQAYFERRPKGHMGCMVCSGYSEIFPCLACLVAFSFFFG